MSRFDGGWIKTTKGTFIAIDPEDAEQIERLAEAWFNVEGGELDNSQPMSVRALRFRAALRKFANPTPPECGHEIEVEGRNYEDRYVCRRDKGHAGLHNDTQAAISWTAYPGDEEKGR